MQGLATAASPLLALPPGAALPLSEGDAFTLQAGRAEVYAMVGDRRMFLSEVAPGAWMFSHPALLILAPDGAQARHRPSTEMAALAADPLKRGELIAALNRWTEALAAGVASSLGERPDITILQAGATAPVGRPVAPERDTIWAAGENLSLFGAPCGVSPVPVAPSAWLVAAGPADFQATAAALRETDWLAGLAGYHALIAAVLRASLRAAEDAEAARIEQREVALSGDLAAVAHEMHAAMTERLRARAPAVGDAAWALMMAVPGASVPDDVEAEADGLEDLAERCGLHARRVTLSGTWWRNDRGRLLARRVQDGVPVALVPDWRGRYRVWAHNEKPVPLNAEVAASLDPAAIEVLRPLPPRPLSVAALVRHGLVLCRSDVAVLAAASLFASLLGLVLPYATGLIVNLFVPEQLRGGVMRLGAALAVVTIGSAGLSLCAALARTRMDGRLAGILQAGVLDRALRLPLAVLRTMSSSDLALRVLSVDQLRRMVTRTLLEGVLGGLFGLSSLLLLFAYSTSGGVITIVLTIVLLGGSWLAGLAQIRALTTGEALTANLASMTLLVQHVVTLRAFGAERRAYVEWVRVATETRRRMLRSRYAIVNYEAGLATFHGLALALVLAFLATGGSGNLSVGGYLAFAAAFQGFLATSEAWGRAIMQIVSAQPVFERTALILETPPEVQPGAKPPGRLEGAVAFSGVAFSYGPDAPPVLTDVTLRVAAGSFVAIVGGSGSGKSTLLSLALGFSRPDRGAVLFDDQDLTGLDVAAVRRQIGVVRQGGRLLGGSLMENIRGMHDCTLDEAWQAAELAGIANDIRAMPMGMHTAVIEGSAGFSGGQVQRLLLARALTGQPRILILDEATSALDNVTQAEVVENISRLGITRIVVAHRLSTIRHADAIHFLHEGAIVESGTFDELMRAGGRFAEFARRQTL